MKAWSPDFVEELLEAPHYRAFLKSFFGRKPSRGSGAPKPHTYASFARTAGFSSRAFVRDVLQGQKRITPSSFPKFTQGLRLSGDWREYFRALVAIEEKDFRASEREALQLRDQLEGLKRRLKSRRARRDVDRGELSADQLLSIPELPEVYAALGTLEAGANFEEVSTRTRLPRAKLKPALDRLAECGLVRFDAQVERYFASDFHVALDRAAQSEYFRRDFERSLARARTRFSQQVDSKDALFLSSTFCIKESEIGRLRQSLRELLLDFVDRAENSTGDRVVELVAAFSAT